MHYITLTTVAILFLASCATTERKSEVAKENMEAKKQLQGIWLSESGTTNLKIKGDSIFYSDSTMTPVSFCIINDSLIIKNSNDKESRYAIEDCSKDLFSFKNDDGDVFSYVKSNTKADETLFVHSKVQDINQCKLIKRDTIMKTEKNKYHAYVQINPSSYKVVNTTISPDGLPTESVYYDNIINLCIYDGGKRLFSRDFRKQDFKKYVPLEYLQQSILSDITVDGAKEGEVECSALICTPNSYTSYVVKIKISDNGHIIMEI